MHYAVLSLLVCTLSIPAPFPAPAPLSAATALNCDGFGYVCGQSLPLCGCGCPAVPADSCMKQAKDDGLVVACAAPDGTKGYCAR
jgi:hypothetical protein